MCNSLLSLRIPKAIHLYAGSYELSFKLFKKLLQKDDEEMVKNFVVYGADVNVKNKKDESPRHLASTSNGKNK